MIRLPERQTVKRASHEGKWIRNDQSVNEETEMIVKDDEFGRGCEPSLRMMEVAGHEMEGGYDTLEMACMHVCMYAYKSLCMYRDCLCRVS